MILTGGTLVEMTSLLHTVLLITRLFGKSIHIGIYIFFIIINFLIYKAYAMEKKKFVTKYRTVGLATRQTLQHYSNINTEDI